MPTTFFFLFFLLGWGVEAGLHNAHKYSLRAHGQIFFFVTFHLCVCVWWTVGRRKKAGDVFLFSLLMGKGNTKLNRIGTRKRNGTVLYRRRMGLQKPKSGRSQMCVQKHWISLLEIINKKFSFFHFFSSFFFRLKGGGYTSAQSIYSAPISQILSKIIIRFKRIRKNALDCVQTGG